MDHETRVLLLKKLLKVIIASDEKKKIIRLYELSIKKKNPLFSGT